MLLCLLLLTVADYETRVVGTRSPPSAASLPMDTLEALPGGLNDPLRQLGTLPGVAMLPALNAQPIVRGGRAGDTQTLIDGMPLPYVFHFGSGFGPAVVPTSLIGGIKFTPSNADARYGGMLGGVIELETAPRHEPLVHGRVSADLLAAAGSLHIAPLPKLSIDAAARRSYVDGLAKLVVPVARNALPLLLPYFTDAQLRVAVDAEALGQFDVLVLGSDDGLASVGGNVPLFGGEALQRLLPATRFVAIKPRWRRGATQLSALVSVGTTEGVIRDTRWQLAVRAEHVLSLGRDVSLRLGVDALATWQQLRAEQRVLVLAPGLASSGMGDALAQVDQRPHRVAAYALLAASFGRLSVDAGLRVEHFSLAQTLVAPALPAELVAQANRGRSSWAEAALSPRLALDLRLATGWHVRVASGLYHASAPALALLAPAPNRLEKAVQSSLGLVYRPRRFVHLELTGFFNWLPDVVVPSVLGVDLPARLTTPVERRAFGAELLARVTGWGGLSGWLSYTLSHSEDVLRGPSGVSATPADFAQTHVLALALSYALPYGLSAGLRFRLGSGWPVTPITERYYDVISDRYEATLGPANSARTPPVHQLDLRVDKRFEFRRWSLLVYAEVLNVYAQRNPELPYYAWDARVRFVSVLPFLPMLGVEARL